MLNGPGGRAIDMPCIAPGPIGIGPPGGPIGLFIGGIPPPGGIIPGLGPIGLIPPLGLEGGIPAIGRGGPPGAAPGCGCPPIPCLRN